MAYKGLACKKHKTYKAKFWPKSECISCMELYDLAGLYKEIENIEDQIRDQRKWLLQGKFGPYEIIKDNASAATNCPSCWKVGYAK